MRVSFVALSLCLFGFAVAGDGPSKQERLMKFMKDQYGEQMKMTISEFVDIEKLEYMEEEEVCADDVKEALMDLKWQVAEKGMNLCECQNKSKAIMVWHHAFDFIEDFIPDEAQKDSLKLLIILANKVVCNETLNLPEMMSTVNEKFAEKEAMMRFAMQFLESNFGKPLLMKLKEVVGLENLMVLAEFNVTKQDIVDQLQLVSGWLKDNVEFDICGKQMPGAGNIPNKTEIILKSVAEHFKTNFGVQDCDLEETLKFLVIVTNNAICGGEIDEEEVLENIEDGFEMKKIQGFFKKQFGDKAKEILGQIKESGIDKKALLFFVEAEITREDIKAHIMHMKEKLASKNINICGGQNEISQILGEIRAECEIEDLDEDLHKPIMKLFAIATKLELCKDMNLGEVISCIDNLKNREDENDDDDDDDKKRAKRGVNEISLEARGRQKAP